MTEKLPLDWYFEAPAPTLSQADQADGKPKRRTFSGVAYSGALVNDGWGSPIVIDLASVLLPASCPTLLQHDRDQRIGVCSLAVADGALACDGYLLGNDSAQKIAADADDGFPWQLSVHAQPGRIEELILGGETTINGRTVAGPALIFRDTAIRELSFTPTGVDASTTAHVWTTPHPTHHSHEAKPMSDPSEAQVQLAQLHEQVADLQTQLVAANTRADTAEAQLAAQARAIRLSAVTACFASLGRTIAEADAGPYLALDDAGWAQVAKDLAAAKPAAPAHLFSEQAVGDPGGPAQVKALNFSAIYNARREVSK